MIMDIIRRTVAVIILNVTSAFVGGQILQLELWQSAAMAAVSGVMGVAHELSRSYLNDGYLDVEEINYAFGNASARHKQSGSEEV